MRVPDAIWLAFFSCSDNLGFSSTALPELALAEFERAPSRGDVAGGGDDIGTGLR